ncbi:MAG: NAD-dependent epimerase/dehydratase family protein [Salinirussus sp.]
MRVAILGCGYVGLALGQALADEHDVVGVRRSESGLSAIRQAGLKPVRADISEPSTLNAVPDADAVVFAASSGGGDAEAARRIYVRGQRQAIDHFAARDEPPERYLYTSSTGVYGDHNGDWVDETTPLSPTTEKTTVLAEAESVAIDTARSTDMTPVVARLAGVYGPNRYRLERYLEGPVTAGYRNLIHRADAAGAAAFLLGLPEPPETVLVVDNEPVDRWTFADWLADECDLPPPEKVTIDDRLEEEDLPERTRRRLEADKRCSNELLRSLGYEFTYPTYREGYRQAIAEYRDRES